MGFVVGFGLIWATLQLTSSPVPTLLRSTAACVATVVCAVAVVVQLWRVSARSAPVAVGLGRPALPGLLVAAGVVVLCAVGYLLFTPLTGRTLGTPPGWLGLLLGVMAEGRSNQAICQRLYLSPKTVEAYVRSVFTKLGLHQVSDDNRRVLAVLAYLRG